jgi:Cu-processing system permease protein
MDWRIVATIAGQELRVNTRNKWTISFAAVFAAMALAISYFGMVTAGQIGFQGFTRTSASLLNLVLYLVPIVSLTMSAVSFTGERGATELLFSQPVTRAEILTGKICGLFAAVAAATCFGFGLAACVIAVNAGTEGSVIFLAFGGFALLLALIFLVIGALVATQCRSKAKTFGHALFVWFFFVLLYDLLVIGITFVLKEHTANQFIFLSLFGNPVDLVRVGSMLALGEPAVFGAAGAALLKFLGGPASAMLMLLSALLLWIAVPLATAMCVMNRQDL